MAIEDRRAKSVWNRMTQAYGARFREQFGKDPSPAWIDAIDLLSDEQVAFGVRKVIREHPIHPPPLGAFTQACNELPTAQQQNAPSGPTIQEQLCAYVTSIRYFGLTDRQRALPWTYLYVTGIDLEKPKYNQRTAQCTGVVIDPDQDKPGYRIMVVDMQADVEGYNRALRSFKPGPGPRKPPPAPEARTSGLKHV